MPRPHDRRDADFRQPLSRPIEDQQLVFDRRGFGYHGTEKKEQIEHQTNLPTLWNLELLSHFWTSPWTGQSEPFSATLFWTTISRTFKLVEMARPKSLIAMKP